MADSKLAQLLSRLSSQISTIIVGKQPQVDDCLACMLAGGHLLIEDVPGVGKTTLAHALAVSLGLKFSLVQFTADLMPSDLTGVSVYERSKEAFVFLVRRVVAQRALAGGLQPGSALGFGSADDALRGAQPLGDAVAQAG